MNTCPDENAIDMFLSGALAGDESGLERHVEECPDCRQLLLRRLRETSLRRASLVAGAGPVEERLAADPTWQRYQILDDGTAGGVSVAFDTLLQRKVALWFPARSERDLDEGEMNRRKSVQEDRRRRAEADQQRELERREQQEQQNFEKIMGALNGHGGKAGDR
jgi:hypothetical protein